MMPTLVDFSIFANVVAPSQDVQLKSALKYLRDFFNLDELAPDQMASTLSDFLKARSDAETCLKCASALNFSGTCALHFRPLQVFRENSHGHEIFVVRSSKCLSGKALEFLKRQKVSKLVGVSGLSDVQLRMTFENFNFETVEREVRAAALAARDTASNGRWLVLGGVRGCGKTHLATAILLQVLQSGQPGRFWLVSELMAKLRSGHSDGSHDSLLDSVKSVTCLVLDDFGGKQKTTEAVFDYLFQLVDYRYRNNLQTVFTTNFVTPRELIDSTDIGIAPVISRIYERGNWVSISKCKDFRIHTRAA